MSSLPAIRPVILAGGSGTRLWPLSRGDYPKQLLDLVGGESLLQATAGRLAALAPASPIVVATEELRFLVAHQLGANGGDPGCIVLEPMPRNTAPAIGAAARVALRDGDDPVLVVMPADHVMRQPERFTAAVATIAPVCAGDTAIATLGIRATRPETGFGYIRRGAEVLPAGLAFAMDGFVEKPDAAAAELLIADGCHYWNGGVLVARASVLLDALERHAPDIAGGCAAAVDSAQPDGCFLHLGAAAFEATPSNSFDYAVMEPLAADADSPIRALVVPLDAGWSDIGSWPALAEVVPHDASGNVIRGDVVARECRNSIVVGTSRLVSTIGIEDLVVVETEDAVLVMPKEHSQGVRDLVADLARDDREEVFRHLRVHRPWGSFERLAQGERYQVKRLSVNPGAALSLQLHRHRAEHWVVVQGMARVTRGEETLELGPDESTYLPQGMRHRLENPGPEILEVIEVQSGDYLGEDDIVRFGDSYKRS